MAGWANVALPLPHLSAVDAERIPHVLPPTIPGRSPRVAEFFAGIGLVRLGLEAAGLAVVWANDVSALKQKLYAGQFTGQHFHLKDVRAVSGAEVPDIELATASFPCTDLSLAGYRRGLVGEHSGLFWEFVRVLREMGERRPQAVLIENVIGFLTSHGGDDLRVALAALNELGYWCDVLTIDARHFVPQSRPRLFIVASRDRLHEVQGWSASAARSEAAVRFAREHALPRAGQPALLLQARAVDSPRTARARSPMSWSTSPRTIRTGGMPRACRRFSTSSRHCNAHASICSVRGVKEAGPRCIGAHGLVVRPGRFATINSAGVCARSAAVRAVRHSSRRGRDRFVCVG